MPSGRFLQCAMDRLGLFEIANDYVVPLGAVHAVKEVNEP